MVKVIGVGGVFFQSLDLEGLMVWYEDKLGLMINDYGGVDFLYVDSGKVFLQGVCMIFLGFKDMMEYFVLFDKFFMINLMIDDMDSMLVCLKEKGVVLEGELQDFDYGCFVWVMDFNGIKIELWQLIEFKVQLNSMVQLVLIRCNKVGCDQVCVFVWCLLIQVL